MVDITYSPGEEISLVKFTLEFHPQAGARHKPPTAAPLRGAINRAPPIASSSSIPASIKLYGLRARPGLTL